MSQLDLVDNDVPQTHENAAASAYVPALQVTAGQPEPIAANGGRSYMAFDRNDDAGTGKALEDALGLIAQGEGRRAVARIAQAPAAGPETERGLGFTSYEDRSDERRVGTGGVMQC